MDLTDRDKSPYKQVHLTVTASNFTPERAVGIAYQTVDGNWRLRFNFIGDITSATASKTFTIAGVVFKTFSGYSQAVTCWEMGGAATERSTASSSGGLIACVWTASTSDDVSISGDVELNGKPDWIE